MSRIFVITILLIALMASVLPSNAQETPVSPTVEISNLSWNSSIPGSACLTFVLHAMGFPTGTELVAAGFPYLLQTGEPFENTSGNSGFTSGDGMLAAVAGNFTNSEDYTTLMWICFPLIYFPYIEGEEFESGYEWQVQLRVAIVVKEQMITVNSFDTSSSLPPMTYAVPDQAARVTNFTTKTATVQGQEGFWVNVTLEAWGYQEQPLRISVYFIDTATEKVVKSEVNNPNLVDPKGQLTRQYVVVPNKVGKLTVWSDQDTSEGSNDSVQLFFPNDAIPENVGFIVPYVVVTDEITGETLFEGAYSGFKNVETK